MVASVASIAHVLYINLLSRTDRMEHMGRELAKIGLDRAAVRFNAVELANAAAGCSMSHLRCLELARANKWPHVVVLEDDIEFLDPDLFVQQLDTFLSGHIDEWDVVLLAGNNLVPFTALNDGTAIKVSHCQTTTGYIVAEHYYDTLIDNYKQGVRQLLRNPDQRILYAIDRWWLPLQQTDRWFLISPLSVVQRGDYSNIEKRHTNFRTYMLTANKTVLLDQITKWNG